MRQMRDNIKVRFSKTYNRGETFSAWKFLTAQSTYLSTKLPITGRRGLSATRDCGSHSGSSDKMTDGLIKLKYR